MKVFFWISAGVLLALGNIVAAGVARGELDGNQGSTSGCALDQPGSDRLTSESCSSCHVGGRAVHGTGHPVDVDYASAAAASASSGGMALRPMEEAVRRGVLLPEGQVRCVTCHEARSPWKYHLAIPPGAELSLSVNPRDPATYEEGPMREQQLAEARAAAAAGKRVEIGTKPLCLACHAAD